MIQERKRMEKEMKVEQTLDNNMLGNESEVIENLVWLSVADENLRLSGFAFYKEEERFQRIPQRFSEKLQEINPSLVELGVHTAGGQIAFRSNTSRVFIRAKVTESHHMVNMTPVAQCGFDLYIGENPRNLKFFGITKFDTTKKEYACEVVSNLDTKTTKEFLLNFPLYAGVHEVEIGIDQGVILESPSPYEKEGKIIFYGTSITQGGCASRPGMAYPSYIARKCNLEHCNFGFSGNGLGEYEVAQMLSEVEQPLLYVLDYEANSGTNGRMVKSLENFIRCLRQKHQEIPILVVSRIPYLLDKMEETTGKLREELRNFQKTTVEKCKAQGDEAIFFCDGYTLWDEEFDEYTVDFIHPTDLGLYFMGKGLTKVIQSILK